jgi:predicted CXXCH cytochrome family protein
MRWGMIAMLLGACTGEAPPRAAESRTPVAPAPTPASAPTPAPAPVAAALPVAADPREATRRTAHDALAEHCGECHEGHRSKAPKALAVFDLDQPDWPARFDEHRSQAALRRLASKPPAARDAFIAFRDAEQAALPARSPGQID